MEEKLVTLQIPVALKEYTALITIKKTYGFKNWRELLNSLIEDNGEMEHGESTVSKQTL